MHTIVCHAKCFSPQLFEAGLCRLCFFVGTMLITSACQMLVFRCQGSHTIGLQSSSELDRSLKSSTVGDRPENDTRRPQMLDLSPWEEDDDGGGKSMILAAARSLGLWKRNCRMSSSCQRRRCNRGGHACLRRCKSGLASSA